MLIKDDKPRQLNRGAILAVAAVILAVGFTAGYGLRPTASTEVGRGDKGVRTPVPAPESLPPLPILAVRYDAAGAATLRAARTRALEQGVLEQTSADVIDAVVSVGGDSVAARIRLKGDWTDHIDTDKWSLRIELKGGRLFGMSRFSVQHPKTRGFVMEWLINEAARREGLLAPRAQFVDVHVNGTRLGIFYLEEHFTKELLEAQGRREGPIVRYDESTLWSAWLQYNYLETGKLPIPVAFSQLSFVAGAKGFDEKGLAKSDSLNTRLRRALEQMADLQRIILAKEPVIPFTNEPMGLRGRQALAARQQKTIDELFVTQKLGRLLALYTFFGAVHGLAWHQFRFYHDPVIDRLEPIIFDTGAQLGGPYGELALAHPYLSEYFASDSVRESAWHDLARFAQPTWLPALRKATEPRLRVIWAHLVHEKLLPTDVTLDKVFADLATHAAVVQQTVNPSDAVNFRAAIVADQDQNGSGHIEVEAWSTTQIPVVLEAFAFGNGERVTASSALAEADADRRRGAGEVVLPRHGLPLTFTFPVNERLLKLRSIEAVTKAIRSGTDPDRSVRLKLAAIHRCIGAAEPVHEDLHLRKRVGLSRGRPQSPKLLAALQTHPCLEYNLQFNLLGIRKGDWEVTEDLLIPPHHALHVPAGTTLRFGPGVVMASRSPILAVGTTEQPILFTAADPTRPWSGLLVFDCEARSNLTHVKIRHATPVMRGGWQTTGAVTFYRAPVDLIGTLIHDVHGEDALNIFGTDFKMLGTTITASTNDLFDGDFVRGTIQDCTFEKPIEDGIDLSGSQVTIENCTFQAIGDKALSLGEGTRATIRTCKITRAAIAVAAKDRSDVEISGLEIGHCEQFAVAVYVKKQEYGPAVVRAENVTVESTGRARYLVQTGCKLSVDRVDMPTEDVDVEAMYKSRILGK